MGAVGASLLALAVTDCRQVASVGQLTAATAACASCVSGSCGDQESTCRQTSACGARLDCELACYPDDVTCRTSCMATPAGDAIGPVDACAETSCAGGCAHACGDLLPIVPPDAAQTCATCIAQQCCDAATTCGSSPECRAGLECARAASVPDAVNTCLGARHPTGTADATALAACVKDGCTQECAYGADWSCLGAVKAPAATTRTIQGTLTVLNGSAQSDGVQGLNVRACYITDEQCGSPVTPTMTTDAHGNVTLSLPATAQGGLEGFLGYFEVTDPKGQYLTGIAIPGFTVTQNGFTQAFIVTTLSEAQSLATAIGRAYDRTTGSLIATASDCAYQSTPGVTFKVDNAGPKTILVYPAYGLPSLTTKHTDSTGVVVGAFLPPGAGTVTVTNAMGQVTSKTPYFTRAGAVTLLLASVNQ